MLYQKVECPHCGNEITVNNAKDTQKCRWCRRLVSVKIRKIGKQKIICEVEPMEFVEIQKKSYSNWKDEDIYGNRKYQS